MPGIRDQQHKLLGIVDVPVLSLHDLASGRHFDAVEVVACVAYGHTLPPARRYRDGIWIDQPRAAISSKATDFVNAGGDQGSTGGRMSCAI